LRQYHDRRESLDIVPGFLPVPEAIMNLVFQSWREIDPVCQGQRLQNRRHTSPESLEGHVSPRDKLPDQIVGFVLHRHPGYAEKVNQLHHHVRV
jgi:hypothetical protein